MDILEQNAMEDLVKKVQLCGKPFEVLCGAPFRCHAGFSYCHERLLHGHGCICHQSLNVCHDLYRSCHDLYCPTFAEALTEVLSDCSEEFYKRCPDLAQLRQHCATFSPSVEAAKFKEQALLERISKLEAKVQELELKKR